MHWESLLYLIGSGGMGALLVAAIPKIIDRWFGKVKDDADAEKTKGETIIAFAAEWEKLYKGSEARIIKLEAMVASLQEQMVVQQKEHSLKENALKERVQTLEMELTKYHKIESKTEDAREILHHTVDESIDEIKKS